MSTMPAFTAFFVLALLIVTPGCSGIPENVSPVTGFDVNRYLGTWYEIARLDHSFERGLDQVTAEYSLRQDGGIRVVNQGFSPEMTRWRGWKQKHIFRETLPIHTVIFSNDSMSGRIVSHPKTIYRPGQSAARFVHGMINMQIVCQALIRFCRMGYEANQD